MTDTTPALDLDAITEKWLRQCGACDAGLAMSCTCPPGDPRNVIDALVAELATLRRELADVATSVVPLKAALAKARAAVSNSVTVMLTLVGTMRDEANEAREILAHRGDDTPAGYQERIEAIEEYAGAVERVAESMRTALAGWTPAKPGDTPGTSEPDDARPQPVDAAATGPETAPAEGGAS